MRFRKLRIAFSVTCGIACVLLIALWARSYVARDMTRGVIGSNHLHLNVTSLRGEVAIAFDEWRGNSHPWIFESVSDHDNMVAVFSSVLGRPPLSWLGFRWQFNPNLIVMVLPYWFLVMLSAVLAAAPWMRWRFTLRTLLIITTLVAAVLGMAVSVARK
jgi:hypothetical protein